MASKLETRLIRLLLSAVDDYQLILPGDRILLAFSGGKDSFGLFQLLQITFSQDTAFRPSPIIYPVLIDLGFPSTREGKKIHHAQEYFARYDISLVIEETDIFTRAHLTENKKNPCFLCARWRREKLYEIGARLDCSKIALAHHRDDIIETFLINIFFSREISTMVPKQPVFKGRFHIIRPLAYIEEKLLQQYAWKNCFPVIDNPCPENRQSKRKFIKDLLNHLEQEEPAVKHNIFMALKKVKSKFLL